jgi:hypothetical protein
MGSKISAVNGVWSGLRDVFDIDNFVGSAVVTDFGSFFRDLAVDEQPVAA